MNSHDLARILLAAPDLPIATHANNHTHESGDVHPFWAELGKPAPESIRVGILQHQSGQHILIGNFSRKRINYPNEYVTEMISGDVPEDWSN